MIEALNPLNSILTEKNIDTLAITTFLKTASSLIGIF
jgi:hypothetical protein